MMLMKKKMQKHKEGYSLEEVRMLTDKYIDEMAERLRKGLRQARKEQAVAGKRSRQGVTV